MPTNDLSIPTRCRFDLSHCDEPSGVSAVYRAKTLELHHMHGLRRDRRNSSALALELSQCLHQAIDIVLAQHCYIILDEILLLLTEKLNLQDTSPDNIAHVRLCLHSLPYLICDLGMVFCGALLLIHDMKPTVVLFNSRWSLGMDEWLYILVLGWLLKFWTQCWLIWPLLVKEFPGPCMWSNLMTHQAYKLTYRWDNRPESTNEHSVDA